MGFESFEEKTILLFYICVLVFPILLTVRYGQRSQGPKYSPQKSRPLESGHRRHGVCIAIECSYKLDQKNEFKFLCELCTFSQIRSHILIGLKNK